MATYYLLAEREFKRRQLKESGALSARNKAKLQSNSNNKPTLSPLALSPR